MQSTRQERLKNKSFWLNNREKLDGNNGLLPAPHIDHLFDKGFISFEDDGRLLRSEALPQSVQDAWGLIPEAKSTPFSESQTLYLAYHRENVFLGWTAQ